MENFLINMAIVKVNWDVSQQSPIDTYLPLIGYAISKCKSDIISYDEISQILDEVAEFSIPKGALTVLLNRSAKAKYKYVKKEHGAYIRNLPALKELRFEETRDHVTRSHNALKIKFQSYCQDTFEETVPSDEVDKYFFEILYEIAPKLIAKLVLPNDPLGVAVRNDFTLRYKVYTFVDHVIENDPEGYNSIDSFVRGAILTEAFYYSLPHDITQKLRAVEVYLDTNFLLRALGYADDFLVKPCSELLDMLAEMNIRTRCFRKTYEEMHGILTAAARAPKLVRLVPDRPGDVFDFFSRTGASRADIELEIAKLDDNLKSIGVGKIVEFPPLNTELGIDEIKLNEYIDIEIPYQSPKSREHDIDCLTATFRLRNGEKKNYLESCKAIFITTNSGLAKTSTRFFNEEYGVSDAPICMTDHIFTMLLWVKVAKKRPELPKQRLVANSYAATNPSDDLWKKYAAEAEKYREKADITEKDYAILVHTLDARKCLMDITRGDSDAFAHGTVMDVLERIKNELLSETRNELVKEQGGSMKLVKNIDRFIDTVSSVFEGLVRWVIQLSLIVCLTIAFILSLPTHIYSPNALSDLKFLQLLAPLAVGLLFVASIMNLMFGTRLSRLAHIPARSLADKVRGFLSNRLRK